ncbi:MAG: serine/threonine protein kinase [Planctomycetes bacterium]|nr:serine/threonine protein kinase [Planctomycetota bacterium]
MNERSIFLEAFDRTDPVERCAYLDGVCGNDSALRSRVEALLAAHVDSSGFLEKPGVPVDRLLAMANTPGTVVDHVPAGRSSAKVRMVDEPQKAFADETTALLHRRLKWVTLVTVCPMALALPPTLALPFLELRILLLVICLGCVWRLYSLRNPSRRQLRLLEVLLFGAVAVQMTVMPAALMLDSARSDHFTTVIMDGYFIQGVWVLVIISYGMLIPNTWQRALMILLPAGLIPYVSTQVLSLYEPKVKEAFDSLHHGTPFPVALVAVAEALFYAHILNVSRWELYRARKFGQYRLQEKLGAGGMGEVYRAEHELLKRSCAIKLIRPGIDADPAAIARFEQEVRATARLSHWNTVEIYDYGRTDEGAFYYVMELLRGLSLDELVRRHGPLPPGRVVYLLTQVCAALREAHTQGLIHRDIKPANIFSASRGGVHDVAKLLDFGLVHQVAGNADDRTEEGVISGSPAYMAPEQAIAGGPVDARCDLYALGGVAYFLLTGRSPFDGATIYDQLAAHRHTPVVPPSKRVEGVPRDLERVVLRCLAKTPGERFLTADALQQALRECECASEWDVERAARWWAACPEVPESVEAAPTPGPVAAEAKAPTVVTVRVRR